MSRIRVPGLIDLLRADEPPLIAALAADPKLDRAYVPRGPLLNRILLARVRRVLALDGVPLPPVAPRGAVRPLPAQSELEARLDACTRADAADPAGDALRGLVAYVRGETADSAVGPLTQQAVGRVFAQNYEGDAESWAAARVLDAAPRSFNPFRLLWWAATGRVAKARRLLADKVGGDPSGVHGTGIAVHNMVEGFVRMRALWADPSARRRLSPEAAALQCLVAPRQVLRQAVAAGASPAGDYEAGGLVLLDLGPAHRRCPTRDLAFMANNWARCPAQAWVPALLAGVWRGATSR